MNTAEVIIDYLCGLGFAVGTIAIIGLVLHLWRVDIRDEEHKPGGHEFYGEVCRLCGQLTTDDPRRCPGADETAEQLRWYDERRAAGHDALDTRPGKS